MLSPQWDCGKGLKVTMCGILHPALIKIPVSDACTQAFVISDLRALRVDPSPCS